MADQVESQVEARTRAMAALRRLDRAWTAVAEQLLSEEGATLAQYSVMTALSGSSPLSGAELARRLGVTAPTMSGLLANLSKRGLVNREQHPSGGRAVLAKLTPAGRALLKRCHKHIDAVEAQFLAEVTPTEFRAVEDVLLRWAMRFERLQERPRLSEVIRAEARAAGQ
jgi:DNA-binding MarR family transcriptional regulator